MKTPFKIYECDCYKCSNMCHAPCTGTVEDMKALMDAGYGNRLCMDDWPGDEVIIVPSLKGHEGQRAPWETRSEAGCTFWHDGKCELHNLGLKPTLGKSVIHEMPDEEHEAVGEFIRASWRKKIKAKKTIDRWKEINGYDIDK